MLCELKKELEEEKFEIEKGGDTSKKEEENLLNIIDLSEKGNESARKIRNTLDNIRRELDNETIIKKS